MIQYKWRKATVKKIKLIVFIMMLFFAVGCGKKEPPTMGIGYCYQSRGGVKVICSDGSKYYINTDYLYDFDYDNGYIYFADVDNVYKANISQNEINPLADKNEFKRITDNYDCVGSVVSLGDSGKVAMQLHNDEKEYSSIYIIDNGAMEYLCEVDGDGINHNSSVNLNKVAVCSDKSGENLFVKQNDQLVKYNIQSKTGTTLVSDFKYDIFDVDGSGDKVAYIYGDCIYLYEISSGKETLIGEMGFPLGKICVSDDGNWIMVIDVTEDKGILPNPYTGPKNNLYIYDCVNEKMTLVLEGGCGSDRGAFDFAE